MRFYFGFSKDGGGLQSVGRYRERYADDVDEDYCE